LAIVDVVRERGPMTVAAFMDLSLYDPEFGYYARAARRSGRAGDFFTSVDVGPVFGRLLEVQLAEMAGIVDGLESQTFGLGRRTPDPSADAVAEARGLRPDTLFDLVEAGAGNGRLAADILEAARRRDAWFYDRIRLHLIETSARARSAHAATLGDTVDRLASSSAALPESFSGAIVANELLDAFPVHQVVMTVDGLREVYVTVTGEGVGAKLTTCDGPVSTPDLAAYLSRAGVMLQPGWRVEINLRAVDWIREVARRVRRGFAIIIDYGHEARELYSAAHATGTLTAYRGHVSTGPESARPAPWLDAAGGQDITAHVDFTSVRAAAEAEGMRTLGFLDQTYFLLGLMASAGLAEDDRREPTPARMKELLALKTLLLPGGLGSTHKVLLLGKNVGSPPLGGCSFRVRAT
jgi:SAM-dependent MidA family methyltransferase